MYLAAEIESDENTPLYLAEEIESDENHFSDLPIPLEILLGFQVAKFKKNIALPFVSVSKDQFVNRVLLASNNIYCTMQTSS